MASENAKAVAKEIVEKVQKGLKINKGEIIKKHGYSDSVAKKPTKVTGTKSYTEVMQPITKEMELLRNSAISALKKKNLYKESVSSLSTFLKNINHDLAVLSGRYADPAKFELTEEEKQQLHEIFGVNTEK